MADVHTKEQRSRNMAAVKARDTKPERMVRQVVYGMGYRYRLHKKLLPGKPDIVLSKSRKVIFIHGCFWHMHHCRAGKSTPQTNAEFWEKKRHENQLRDRKIIKILKTDGWDTLIIWECEIKNSHFLDKLSEFLIEG